MERNKKVCSMSSILLFIMVPFQATITSSEVNKTGRNSPSCRFLISLIVSLVNILTNYEAPKVFNNTKKCLLFNSCFIVSLTPSTNAPAFFCDFMFQILSSNFSLKMTHLPGNILWIAPSFTETSQIVAHGASTFLVKELYQRSSNLHKKALGIPPDWVTLDNFAWLNYS